MSINVSNLIIKLQQKISTSDNEEILLYYSKALQQLRSGTINTVNKISDLPSSAENKGKMFLVKDEKEIYWSAGVNGSWNSLTEGSSQLFSWGLGTCGRLGDGTLVTKCSPVREISSSISWCDASAGFIHSAAVKTDGTLWSWGEGTCGRLGDGTLVTKCSPVREISSSTNWCTVSAGHAHSAAIKTDGTLWSWGKASYGMLGDGTVVSKSSPVREITSSTNWCGVDGGCRHSLAVKTDGTLWSWGVNSIGMLGDGTLVDKSSPVREISSSTTWCRVSGGSDFSASVKTDGTIWSWGNNNSGRLGDGTATIRCSPVREISSSTTWCSVSAGYSHSVAVKTDGTLWSWGEGSSGRLGDGTGVSKSSPVQEISLSTKWCSAFTSSTHSIAIEFVET